MLLCRCELQSDHGPAAGRGRDFDATAMGFGNAAGDGEAESATCPTTAVSTPEALEDYLAFLDRDTRPVIANSNDRAGTGRDLNTCSFSVCTVGFSTRLRTARLMASKTQISPSAGTVRTWSAEERNVIPSQWCNETD